jgi:Rhodopirellula transposase DDE domain
LLDDLNALVEPDARGDPMSPLRWTCKSLRRLAAELDKLGHKISHTVVGELLKKQKFSLQANSKTREGADNPDRDAQFGVINDAVKTAMAENQPAISVDTKKKELVGDFKNGGREWRKQGDPEEVRVHDFLIKELGRAVPYGVYDPAANAGWVNVGIDNDTAAFAVQTIRRWWQDVGRVRYPLARRLVITADGGGSKSSRVRLWKRELQRLADELGISFEVQHLPPGTSNGTRSSIAVLVHNPSRPSHSNWGYSLFSLTRAFSVVNCQLALAWCLFRWLCQATTSFSRVGLSGMRRLRHWAARTASSDSAMSSQLPCFGV